MSAEVSTPTREQLLHALYEAAELEHNLMCTYLYAAFSLRDGRGRRPVAPRGRGGRALAPRDHAAWRSRRWGTSRRCGTSRRRSAARRASGAATFRSIRACCRPASWSSWRRSARTCCSTSSTSSGRTARPSPTARASSPSSRSQRGVRLAAPHADAGSTTRRSACSTQRSARACARSSRSIGEDVAFCGDPALQLSPAELELRGAKPVICSRPRSRRFAAIVEQGEGAPGDSPRLALPALRRDPRRARARCKAREPELRAGVSGGAQSGAAPPAARREGRVWIENEEAARDGRSRQRRATR